MTENDPARLADDLEQEADDMQHRSAQLGNETEGVAQDWERKRSDPAVPGAPPNHDDDDDEGDDDDDDGEESWDDPDEDDDDDDLDDED